MFSSEAEAIASITAGLDFLASRDRRAYAPTEVVAEHVKAMHVVKNRVDALTAQSVRWFERWGDPQGHRNAASWVAWTCKVSKRQANAERSIGRAMDSMPAAAAASLAGDVSVDHLRLLAAADRATPWSLAELMDVLLDSARNERFDEFHRRVEYVRQATDRDGSEKRARDAFERRSCHASKTFEGTVEERSTLDPIGGAIYLNELDRLERELFELDWAEARARLGPDAAITETDLGRTSARRRADAKVQMALRSAAKRPGAKEPRILLSVLIGYETFHGMMCQLADGTVVTPSTLADVLPLVDVERVVFGSRSEVLDVGVRQRLFVGGTRRAVEVRDRFCTFEGCDVPYDRCDVDHVEPFALGGETRQSNGRLRCPAHNPGRRRPKRPPDPPPDPVPIDVLLAEDRTPIVGDLTWDEIVGGGWVEIPIRAPAAVA